MSEKVHTVEAKWRAADATAYEERVKAISDWLEHTEDLLALFKHDEESAQVLRSTAGMMKTKKSDFSDKAEDLRAQLAGEKEKTK
jgi:hypothetical protein